MRTIRKIWSKWYIQLTVILLVFILGLSGYTAFYRMIRAENIYLRALYSTIRLFACCYDADTPTTNGPDYERISLQGTGYDITLEIAKWLALLITGTAIFRIIKPLTIHLGAEIKYWIWKCREERMLIIGCNEDNLEIYKSAEIAGKHPMIECSSEDDFWELKRKDINCITIEYAQSIANVVRKTLLSEVQNSNIIINTKNEEENLSICRNIANTVGDFFADDITKHDELCVLLKKYQAEQKALQKNMKKQDIQQGEREKQEDKSGEDLATKLVMVEEKISSLQKQILQSEKKTVERLERLHVVVFGDKKYETTYQKMEEKSLGVLRYTNKYRMTALDLVSRYPMTAFIDKEAIDEYGCIDKEYSLNVILIGFGDTNQELFLSSICINQFIKGMPGEIPSLKLVNYYIYDKEDVKTNKNLNHQVFRFGLEFMSSIESGTLDRGAYLQLPEYPGRYFFNKTDINDCMFYEQIKKICTKNPKSCNFIVVAIGEDLENIDLAQKLFVKKMEWLCDNLRIFVKVRNADNAVMVEGHEKEGLYWFGDEKVPLNATNLFDNHLEEMARKKHYLNALIRSRSRKGFQGSKDEIEIKAIYEWHMYDSIRKKSSIYSILSMKMKLQLIGLDYRIKQDIDKKQEDNVSILKDNNAYFSIYAKDNRPVVDKVLDSVNGIEVYLYNRLLGTEDLKRYTLRQNLAVQEHYRWNAYMISCGFIPATKQQIIEKNKERGYTLRYHGNLTTVEGLIEYRKMVTKQGENELRNDVINYDFHLMDEIWWYLDMFGYEVVVR